jgi:hypothetical protein
LSEKRAISILKKNHETVKGLFEEFENTDSAAEKEKIIARRAVKELEIPASNEESRAGSREDCTSAGNPSEKKRQRPLQYLERTINGHESFSFPFQLTHKLKGEAQDSQSHEGTQERNPEVRQRQESEEPQTGSRNCPQRGA